jgi:hypothetical protein
MDILKKKGVHLAHAKMAHAKMARAKMGNL